MSEGAAWLEEHGLPAMEQDTGFLEDNFKMGHTYLIPAQSARKTALATHLAEVLRSFSSTGALWISGFSVWEAENWGLFDGYRRSIGEVRPLNQAPYHLFEAADYKTVESLVIVVLYFMWDAVLIDTKNIIGFQFSHDEWLAIAAADDRSLELMRRQLARFRLESHPREE